MREEEEPNWFARWEEQLPSPDELTPLSQSLITLPLAMAFDIVPNPNPNPNPNTLAHNPLAHHGSSGPHFDPSDPAVSSAGGSSGAHNGCGADEPARTLKRPRLVWTPQLHKRFVDAVAHLGIKNAVPKTIMQLMSVDGLTRENVASHLQKYRLYLKRMQGIGTGGSSPSGNGTGPLSASEAATEQLFASGPVPHHFLTGRSPGPVPPPDPYIPFVPSVPSVPTLQHHHHHQMGYNHHQFYNQRSNGLSQFNGFDHNGFFTRSVQVPTAQHHHRVGPGGIGIMPGGSAYMDELEMSGRAAGGAARRELTLFPTGDH